MLQKNKLLPGIICILFSLILGFYVGYKLTPQQDIFKHELLNRKLFYDSVRIMNRDIAILAMKIHIDSLTEINDSLSKIDKRFIFDTTYIRQIQLIEKDTIVKAALNDCIENDRILNNQITRLEQIKVSQEMLITSMSEQIENYKKYNTDLKETLIECRSDNEYLLNKNKRLKKQRNFGIITSVGLIVLVWFIK